MSDLQCPFCHLDDPSVVVVSDRHVLAVVSRAPINRYHVLVVPRVHVEQFTEIRGDVAASIWSTAQKVARSIKAVAQPDGITYITDDDLTGQGYNLVPHWKLHVIARFRDENISLDWARGPDPGLEVRSSIASSLRLEMERV
ncbi:MAG: HIT family protein [Pseudoxanthomonas sp.]